MFMCGGIVIINGMFYVVYFFGVGGVFKVFFVLMLVVVLSVVGLGVVEVNKFFVGMMVVDFVVWVEWKGGGVVGFVLMLIGGFEVFVWCGGEMQVQVLVDFIMQILNMDDFDEWLVVLEVYQFFVGQMVCQVKVVQDLVQQVVFMFIESGGDLDGFFLDQKMVIGQEGMLFL